MSILRPNSYISDMILNVSNISVLQEAFEQNQDILSFVQVHF